MIKVIHFRDDADEFRFRIMAANGEELAKSSEGYEHEADCVHAAHLIIGPGRSDDVEFAVET